MSTVPNTPVNATFSVKPSACLNGSFDIVGPNASCTGILVGGLEGVDAVSSDTVCLLPGEIGRTLTFANPKSSLYLRTNRPVGVTLDGGQEIRVDRVLLLIGVVASQIVIDNDLQSAPAQAVVEIIATEGGSPA